VVDHAARREAQAVVVTFDPHPAAVHHPEQGLARLQSLSGRLAALEALGVDAVLVVPYTLDVSRLTPEEFVQSYLVQGLAAAEVVLGGDARFGADNSGDVETMRRLGRDLGFAVTAVEDQADPEDAARDRWSSTSARQALAQGDDAHAARILGRPHRVTGVVVHGDGRGRTLGFPTANLGAPVAGFVPADGVYAGYMVRPSLPAGSLDRTLPAAVSVGVNPTFDGRDRRVEAYALGRDDLDLYGEEVAVDFVARLRHTLAFEDQAALVTQMHDDAAAASRVLLALPSRTAPAK
jgi:riboflavin kinase/FMN adenylyltransferase